MTFEPNEAGFAQFESYLSASAAEPACFLVDLIEEDYVLKHVAHCSRSSQRALIKRALSQQFRDLSYTCAQYQGPAIIADANPRKGQVSKKQDVFLLSALTNPTIMDPWLARIRDAGVALAGIYSVAHLMPKILQRLQAKKSSVLLITQEVSTAFRQSYFQQGQLHFARVSKLPHGSRDTETSAAFASLLVSEIEQTLQYLELQRRIELTDLEVHCLVPSAYHSVVASAFDRATEQAQFYAHDLTQVIPRRGLSGDYADSLLAWLCARAAPGCGHYDANEDKIRFASYQTTQRMNVASVATVVGAASLSIFFTMQAFKARESAVQINQMKQNAEQFYQSQYGHLQTELSLAEQIRDAVVIAEAVKRKAQVTPQDFLVEFSKIMSEPQFHLVSLRSIDWRTGLGGEQHFQDLMALRMAEDPNFDPFSWRNSNKLSDAEETDVNIGVISGHFKITPDSSYREIVALANDFVAAIRAHDRVERVDILTLPVEHRSYKPFTDVVSQKTDQAGGVSINGHFKFRIIMRGPLNA